MRAVVVLLRMCLYLLREATLNVGKEKVDLAPLRFPFIVAAPRAITFVADVPSESGCLPWCLLLMTDKGIRLVLEIS